MSQICVLSYGKLLIMTWIICSTTMFYHTIQSYSHLEQPDHSMDVITNKYTTTSFTGGGFILNPSSRVISVSLVELLLHLQIHIPLWSNQAKSILLCLDDHFTRLHGSIDMVVLYQVFIVLAD